MRQFLHRVRSCLSEFMNTWDEWHAFWIGFFNSALTIFNADWGNSVYEEEIIESEPVYYKLGRTLGYVVFGIFVVYVLRQVV